jgi:signal transduction histidine kinase/ActR/RegA family two-component response regulator
MAAIPRSADAASPQAALADMSVSARRLNRWIGVVIAGLVVAPILAVVGGASWLRAIAVSEGRARLAEVLAMTAHHSDTVFQVNAEIARQIALAAGQEAAGLTLAARLHGLLSEVAARHDHVTAILLTDREGRILLHSHAFPAPAEGRFELPDLAALAGEGPQAVALTPPRLDPVAGAVGFGLVVPRIEAGRVVGAVVVETAVGYLQAAYGVLAPVSDFVVAWVDRDGWVLSRRPALEAPIRLDPGGAQMRALSGGGEGEFEEVSPIDGVRRHVAWRRLARWPVAVVVAGGRSGLAAAHDRVTIAFGLALLGASGAIGALALALRRAAGRHAALVECVIEADAARRKAEDQLHQAQKLEAVGLLTGGVAHDFNNLLAILMGCTESLQARFPDDRAVRETTEVMIVTIERGARLTADLLSFARKQMLFPVACDVSRQIAGSRTLLAKAAGEANQLVFDLAPIPLPVRVDPSHLDACLINLVSNAHDVIERDGRIVVRTRLRTIGPEERGLGLEPGDYAVIDVEDNGRGMPPAIAARAFEPFFTTKALGRGTGLGLAMVYGFAQQSGGTALIESQPGRGTRVSVLLPVTKDVVATPPPRTERPPERLSVHVLLVDDDPTVRQVMAETLKSLGATVSEAADAAEARARIAAEMPGLLVTDVVMPGDMNGYELAAWARRGGRRLPVLLISGFAGSQLPEELAGSEAIAFLPKPIARADLAAAIVGLLRDQRRLPSDEAAKDQPAPA